MSIRAASNVFAVAFILAVFAGPAGAQDLKALSAGEKRFFKLIEEGKYQLAEAAALDLVKLAERDFQRQPEYIGMMLGHLAGAYYNNEKYDEAEAAALRSIAILRRTMGANHELVANPLTNLGNTHWLRRRYEEAARAHQEALKLRLQKGNDTLNVAESLENLAICYGDLGRGGEADNMMKRALAIRQKRLGPDHHLVLQTIYNMGVDYKDHARLDEALVFLEHARQGYTKKYGPSHPRLAYILNNLASIAEDQDRFDDAEKLLLQALEINRKTLGDDHPFVAADESLAELYSRQDRDAEAARLWQRALDYYDRKGLGDSLDAGRVWHGLAGRFNDSTKDLAAADKAVDISSRRGASPEMMVRAHMRRGLLRYGVDRPDANEDFRAAMNLSERLRGTFSGMDQSRSEAFLAYANSYWYTAHSELRANRPKEAFDAFERGRARTLIDQMAAAHVDPLSGVAAAEVATLRASLARAELNVAQLEKQADQLANRKDLSEAVRKAQTEQVVRDLATARYQLVEAHAAIRNASPAYRQVTSQDFMPMQLEPLFFWLHKRKSLMLYYTVWQAGTNVMQIGRKEQLTSNSIKPNAEQAKILGVEPGPMTDEMLRKILEEGDDSLLARLSDPKRAAEAEPQLAALYEILIPAKERQGLTDGTYDCLIIVPDGPLARLPFESLVVERGAGGTRPKYFLDVCPPIAYAPSATVLTNLAAQPKVPTKDGLKPVLTVGDPAYGETGLPTTVARNSDNSSPRARFNGAGGRLSRLPFTAAESNWVKDVFTAAGIPAGQLLTTAATEASVRYNLPGRRIVHLACHGMADASYGNLFGALALTPGPQAGTNLADDGFLTLAEIYNLDLRGCELSILSACQTNYGPQQKNETLWALTRGFLVAGSRRVVASNWLVDDEAGASLISAFCSGLAKAEQSSEPVDYARALHAAKRSVCGQEKWRAPYYWAPFVLMGPN